MAKARLVAVMSMAATAVVLSACSGSSQRAANPAPCPQAFALYDAARKVEFRGEENFDSVGFTGEIQDVNSLCQYSDDRPIKADLQLEMEFGRGPAAMGEKDYTYKYFVAVTRRDLAVLHKEEFEVDVRFPGRSERVTRTERISEILIPRADSGVAGGNFEIIVGFVLDDEELAFNRAGKRFRVTAGQGSDG